MALEKIALVKSLCGSEQKCDVNYESPQQRQALVVSLLEEAVTLLDEIEDVGLEAYELEVSKLAERLANAVDKEEP